MPAAPTQVLWPATTQLCKAGCSTRNRSAQNRPRARSNSDKHARNVFVAARQRAPSATHDVLRACYLHNSVTAVGFEPTPLRTGALSQRLRPLGQTVSPSKRAPEGRAPKRTPATHARTTVAHPRRPGSLWGVAVPWFAHQTGPMDKASAHGAGDCRFELGQFCNAAALRSWWKLRGGHASERVAQATAVRAWRGSQPRSC